MALGTDEQIIQNQNQIGPATAGATVLTKVTAAPSVADGGVVNSAIQQDDLAEDIQKTSTLGIGLSNDIVEKTYL